LADGGDTITRLIGTVDQASDALAYIAANDRESVRSAAADGDLYVPRRLLPEKPDLPYRYAPALPAMTDALLATYDATTHAAIRATAALDSLALALNPQPTIFATLRATAPLSVPSVPHSPALPARTPATRSRPGRLERELRHRGISEPTLLARAADIDDTAQDLISAAIPPSQRQATTNRAILRAVDGSPAHGQHPARLAAKDVAPYTTSNTPLPRLVPINHPIRHQNATRHRLIP
jgi:hypothetical protein